MKYNIRNEDFMNNSESVLNLDDFISDYYEEKLLGTNQDSSQNNVTQTIKNIYGQLFAAYYETDESTITIENDSSLIYSWKHYLQEFVEEHFLFSFEIVNTNETTSKLICKINPKKMLKNYPNTIANIIDCYEPMKCGGE